MRIRVYKVLMNNPADASALNQLIGADTIDQGEIVVLIGKTEGNGGANDFTRLATLSFSVAQALNGPLRPAIAATAIAALPVSAALAFAEDNAGILLPGSINDQRWNAAMPSCRAPNRRASGRRRRSELHLRGIWGPGKIACRARGAVSHRARGAGRQGQLPEDAGCDRAAVAALAKRT
jgi:hypothetical protein